MLAGSSLPTVGARRLVARAGSAAALALVGACVVPPRPIAPSPEALPATPPAVSVWSPNAFPGSTAFPGLFFSTDRPGYATVFEADRRGRVRVIYPRTPREDGRVQPGRTYAAASSGIANDRLFLEPATDWRRLPFLFVVVSDARPDLSDFGRGRAWQRQVRTEGGVEAEDVIEAVAQRVTAGSGRPFATDFTYLGPRLTPREALFAASCAIPARDARDYWYFRDLWAVFTPADPTLGLTPVFAFGSVVTWASTPYLGVAFDRAQFATAAFQAGCFNPSQPGWGGVNPLLFAAGRQFWRPIVATGTPATPAAPAGPVATTPTPPAGAVIPEPRIPRTPRVIADGTLRPDGGAASPVPQSADRQMRSWITSGMRQTGTVVAEPLERPAGDPARRWGTPTTWATGAMTGDAGNRAEREYIRGGRSDGGWAGGNGSTWARRLGGSEGGRASGGSDDRSAGRSAPPPAREVGSAGRSAGGWAGAFGGGANGSGRIERVSPAPASGGGERTVAPMASPAGGSSEGGRSPSP